MRLGQFARHKGVRSLGITLLIFGLIPIPWPQLDFHNVRHHDGVGEFCEFHDHLLVWHPDAGLAEDVAVWHCHWFLADWDLTGMVPAGEGPVAHSHVPGPPHVACCDAPRVTSSSDSRSAGRDASWSLAVLSSALSSKVSPRPTPAPPARLALPRSRSPCCSIA
ncbi:MAG: hypothetical protein WKF75_05480 [Singulisphaera sp.]